MNKQLDFPRTDFELIQTHRRAFDSLILDARRQIRRGNLEAAAVLADIADEYASFSGHCGFFASRELEDVLVDIGMRLGVSQPRSRRGTTPNRILHVVWGVWNTGGHSRFLWRWIRADSAHEHSVVLTRMPVTAAPAMLTQAVAASGGKVHELVTVGFTQRAIELRALGSGFDLIVLHTVYDGATPMMAFADASGSPPVVYVNHADERHWSGVRISRMVANIRESGRRLTVLRRGVAADRNCMLPVPIDLPQRRLSRTQAKQQLGIACDTVLLVSIARAVKYGPSGGSSFVGDHLAAMRADPRLFLIVVGPGGKACDATNVSEFAERVQVLPETSDTALYYQAADIYVDSAPFVSNTSLLEAGSYGTPLITRYPFASADCEVLAAGMPGLDGQLLQVACTPDEYTALILRLAADEQARERLGAATRDRIERIHTGRGWLWSVEQLYRAACCDEGPIVTDIPAEPSLSELDLVLEQTAPFDRLGIADLIAKRLSYMSRSTRLRFWFLLAMRGQLTRSAHLAVFPPGWTLRLIMKELRRVKRSFANWRLSTGVADN